MSDNGNGASPTRVVLADDAEELRVLLRLLLEVEGTFEIVAEVGDGDQAITAVDEHRPDCLVLDLAMPNMSGMVALPRLRARHPNLAILVLSGFAAGDYAELAISAGADDYLEKGPDMDGLGARLRELVS